MMHGFSRSYSGDYEHYHLDNPLSHRALWTTQHYEPVAECLGFESASHIKSTKTAKEFEPLGSTSLVASHENDVSERDFEPNPPASLS